MVTSQLTMRSKKRSSLAAFSRTIASTAGDGSMLRKLICKGLCMHFSFSIPNQCPPRSRASLDLVDRVVHTENIPAVPSRLLTRVNKKESKEGKKRSIIGPEQRYWPRKIAEKSKGTKDQEGLGARHRAHLSRHPWRDQDQVSPPFPPQRFAGAPGQCACDDRLRR